MTSAIDKQVIVICPNPSVDIFAWVENFHRGMPNRITREERYPGGKGLHVAMALSELGVGVTVIGFWGGEAGQWLQTACNDFYPAIKFAGPQVKEWSRSCYTFKSTGDFDDTEILGPGPTVSDVEYEQLLEAVEKQLPKAALIALCGSWPKGSPETGYQKIITLAKDHQVRSFLDCTGAPLNHALEAKPYGVHLNRKEITSFYNTTDFEQAKQEMLKSCEVAAITDGARGLSYLTPKQTFHGLARVDTVISTIGSGDCLLAGIIAGHIRQLEPQRIAHLGAACGAANCIRPELGMLYEQDVIRLYQSLETELPS